MDRMKKYILLICAAAMLLLPFLYGCLGADLEECPPGLNYSISFEYLIHPKDPADLFTEDVEKVTVYVFDAISGNCVYSETTSAYAWQQGGKNDYAMSLPLNAGDYDIIIWGWGYEKEEYYDRAMNLGTATPVVRNVPTVSTVTSDTRLTDPGVQLRINTTTEDSDTVENKIERTFFGQLRVNIPPMTANSPAVRDTIPLLNIANRIRVVIKNAQENGNRIPDWANNLRASLVGTNQAYYFNPLDMDRTKRPVGWLPPVTDNNRYAPYFVSTSFGVTYKAYNKHLTDEILVENQIVNYGTEGIDSLYIADISTMRMIAGDEDLALHVEWDGPGLADDIKLLNIDKTGHPENDGLIIREFKKYYNTAYYRDPTEEEIQYELDRQYDWIVFIELPNNLGDTRMTATLYMIDWSVVDDGGDIGNSDVKF